MSTSKTVRRRIEDIARSRFGFDTFHPGQFESMQSVIEGRDTLSVMPTGSGKSAIYQIAGLVRGGVTIVVSPLIALQQDQVESIAGMNIGRAAEINSTLNDGERNAIFDDLTNGTISFVFIAPEQFSNDQTRERLIACHPSLFVVDEAHCISEWGHDFRPDYLRLGEVVDALGHPTILAMTATATAPVRREIIERLGMSDPAVIVRGFDRPNIHLAVRAFNDEDEKASALIDCVAESQPPGIVYAATRHDTEAIAAALVERGISAAAYHAGLRPDDRAAIHAAFRDDEICVVAATIAFGMGVDKPNVRFVYHHDVSDSIDSYYQEVGRAGRDGEPAEATLFYRPDDLNLRKFQNGAGELTGDEVEPVITALARAKGDVAADLVRQTFDIPDTRLMRILGRLEDAGAIDLLADGGIRVHRRGLDIMNATRAAVEEQRNHQHFVASRLEMMRQYAELGDCRREFLLHYFGEPFDGPCSACDNCDRGVADGDQSASHPFPINALVRHATFGDGTVTHYRDGNMVVLFDKGGYRTLAIDLVMSERLLEAAKG